ncbi:hypothetical protein CANCADRAFT_19271, partial [Tortispora caseinolytica NRRL Y-17796]
MFTNPSPVSVAYGGILQFLTNITLFVTLVTCCIGTIADITKSALITSLKDKLAASIFSIEVVVACVYWPLKFYDKSLIVNNVVKMIPVPLDLTIHVLPVLVLLIDIALSQSPSPISSTDALMFYVVYGLAYWIWIHHTRSVNDFFPYPFLDKLNHFQRTLMLIFCVLLAFVSHLLVSAFRQKLLRAP